MVAEIYCAAGASQIPAAHCEPAFPEKGGISLLLQRSRQRFSEPPGATACGSGTRESSTASLTARVNSHEFSYAVVLRNLPRQLCDDGLRDRTHLSRLGRDPVGEIDLPATLEIVNVHDHFGIARQKIGLFAQPDPLRANDGIVFSTTCRCEAREYYVS
jgi:hypothetical protein